jgi:hypothetical protein
MLVSPPAEAVMTVCTQAAWFPLWKPSVLPPGRAAISNTL